MVIVSPAVIGQGLGQGLGQGPTSSGFLCQSLVRESGLIGQAEPGGGTQSRPEDQPAAADDPSPAATNDTAACRDIGLMSGLAES